MESVSLSFHFLFCLSTKNEQYNHTNKNKSTKHSFSLGGSVTWHKWCHFVMSKNHLSSFFMVFLYLTKHRQGSVVFFRKLSIRSHQLIRWVQSERPLARALFNARVCSAWTSSSKLAPRESNLRHWEEHTLSSQH